MRPHHQGGGGGAGGGISGITGIFPHIRRRLTTVSFDSLSRQHPAAIPAFSAFISVVSGGISGILLVSLGGIRRHFRLFSAFSRR